MFAKPWPDDWVEIVGGADRPMLEAVVVPERTPTVIQGISPSRILSDVFSRIIAERVHYKAGAIHFGVSFMQSQTFSMSMFGKGVV